MKRYNPSQLYTPAVNMQLGTRYFKGMVDKFGGSFEYALAAYNAGSERMDEWLSQGCIALVALFVAHEWLFWPLGKQEITL